MFKFYCQQVLIFLYLFLKIISTKNLYSHLEIPRIRPKRSIAATKSYFEEDIESDESNCDKGQQKVPPLKIRKKNKNVLHVGKVSFLSKAILMNIMFTDLVVNLY